MLNRFVSLLMLMGLSVAAQADAPPEALIGESHLSKDSALVMECDDLKMLITRIDGHEDGTVTTERGLVVFDSHASQPVFKVTFALAKPAAASKKWLPVPVLIKTSSFLSARGTTTSFQIDSVSSAAALFCAQELLLTAARVIAPYGTKIE